MSLRASLAESGYLGIAAAMLLVLNLVDAVFTIGFVQLGLAEEANPLMEFPLSASPVGFMLVKLTLVSLCVTLLWRLQEHRSAIFAMFGGAFVYCLLFGYHLHAVRMFHSGFAG